MPTYRAPGVYIEEVDTGPKPIEAVATAVAGFVGLAARGPLNEPISVNRWGDFVRHFGGLAADSLMSYAAFGYFNNGGQNAFVIRVAREENLARAFRVLRHRGAPPPAGLTLAAGVAAGATFAYFDPATSVEGIAPGDTLEFFPAGAAPGDPATDTVTVEVVDATLNLLAWDSPLANAYPPAATVTPTDAGGAPAALALAADLAAGDLGGTLAAAAQAQELAAGDQLTFVEGATTETVTLVRVDGRTGAVAWDTPLVNAFTQAGATVNRNPFGGAYPAGVTLLAGVPAGATQAAGIDPTGLAPGDEVIFTEGTRRDAVTVVRVDAAADGGLVTWTPALFNAYTPAAAVAVRKGTALPGALDLLAITGARTGGTVDSVQGVAVGDRLVFIEEIGGVATAHEAAVRGADGATQALSWSAALPAGFTTGADLAVNPGLRVLAAPYRGEARGSWGNDITLRVEDASLTQTTLDGTLGANALQAVLETVRNVHRGSLLELTDTATGNREVRRVALVDEPNRRVEWNGPLANGYPEATSRVRTLEFRLTAGHRWLGLTEQYNHLSMDPQHPRYAPHVIDPTLAGGRPEDASQLIRVEDLVSGAALPVADPLRLPATTRRGETWRLAGGANGSAGLRTTDVIGQDLGPDRRTGIQALANIDEVTIVLCPDAVGFADPNDVQAVQQAMVEHCEALLDRFAVLDSRRGLDLQQVQDQRAAFDSKYGAFYYPWIWVDDPLSATGDPRPVPPSGHVAGVYARVDETRGVHKAPANEVVLGARRVELPITMAEQNLLNPLGINCIRRFRGRGIRIWGARTISSDPSWRYVNVRRLFNQVEESIEEGTQWVVFEPNDPTLWGKIVRDVRAFLFRFWRNGAFFGETEDQAFFVKCDEETNPPEVIDAGQVIIEVGIAPVKPAEFVIFRIGQKATGATISE